MSSISINYCGRLGNHIIMHLMAQYFAEKNNLMFENKMPDEDFYNFFDINVSTGEKKNYTDTIIINDNNAEDLLFSDDTSNKNILKENQSE